MKKTCENCEYFILHYIKSNKGYRLISLGHCIYPRIKNRDKDTLACANWSEKLIAD